MEPLASRVDGKPVAVLAHGPSLDGLWPLLAGRDMGGVAWVTMNHMAPVAERLGRLPDVWLLAAGPRIDHHHADVSPFVQTGGILTTRPSGWRQLRRYPGIRELAATGQVQLVHCERDEHAGDDHDGLRAVELWPPVRWEVPSVAILTVACLAAGAGTVVVFGADGRTDGPHLYAEGVRQVQASAPNSIQRDTQKLSENWLDLLANLPDDCRERVWNACPGSALTCWTKCTQEAGLELLS